MSAPHPSTAMIARYAAGVGLPADAGWAVEAHLERCAGCRGRLADAVAGDGAAVPGGAGAVTGNGSAVPGGAGAMPGDGGAVAAIVHGVWAAVEPQLRVPPARRRAWPRLFRWAAPAALPWLAMTVVAPVAAVLLDLAARHGGGARTPLLLLVAPIVPIFGVAGSWSRRLDPAGELISCAARSGLALVLRRTLAVLLTVMPVLAAGGAAVGAAPVRWLLPCLVCTVGTLALGAVIGVAPAAAVVGVGWTAAVVVPGIVHSRVPVALEPASTPVWAGCAVLAIGALIWWRNGFRHPASHR